MRKWLESGCQASQWCQRCTRRATPVLHRDVSERANAAKTVAKCYDANYGVIRNRLCSTAADFITGQTMVIDGGQFFH